MNLDITKLNIKDLSFLLEILDELEKNESNEIEVI